jgi:hypothetical protein
MFRPYRREGGNPARPVWLPGLAARYDQCFPLRKSVAKVWAIDDRTARLAVISPSSRFWLREVLEKFSDPMNTFACRVP